MKQILHTGVFRVGWLTALVAATLGALLASAGALPCPSTTEPGEGPRVSEERTGTLSTGEGLRLRLVTELGNVRILTQEAGKEAQVTYRLRLEADARQPNAQSLLKQFVLNARSTTSGVQLIGEMADSEEHSSKRRARLWVTFEVSVPRRYDLDVTTQAGNIDAQDLEGHARLITSGGNITAGRLGGPEAAGGRLETAGGHVTVQDVNGELRASTGGGHISAANVRGNAVLQTGGGHIRVGEIQGPARLETGGGNISIQRAGGNVTASTGGGQIELGEIQGSIRAQTGGGGIRIGRVTAPAHLESGGGSIFLSGVQSAVRATTGAGSITALFTSGGKLVGVSLLESGSGDIIVYLPRELALTIHATIEGGPEHRIEVDPSLSAKVSYVTHQDGVRGEYTLNGGGELLRLKTVAGDIHLKLGDANQQMLLDKQIKGHLEVQKQRLMERLWRRERPVGLESPKEKEKEKEDDPEDLESEIEQDLKEHEREFGRLEELAHKFERAWWGAVRVDAETQQKRLIRSVRPEYPDVAKQAGIEGRVRLKAVIGQDGNIQNLKVLSGQPVLADAAMAAVRQWRYQPILLEGRPVNVLTTIVVDFRLK